MRDRTRARHSRNVGGRAPWPHSWGEKPSEDSHAACGLWADAPSVLFQLCSQARTAADALENGVRSAIRVRAHKMDTQRKRATRRAHS